MHKRDACATNGSPKPEYNKDARLEELATFEVQLAYDIDPMSDDFLAPKGLVNMPDTGELIAISLNKCGLQMMK